MKPIRLVQLVALAALASLPARAAPSVGADTPFGAFQSVCLTPNADFEKVTAAAASWRPTEVTGDATLAGVTVSNRLTRATKVGGVPLTLFAWTGTMKTGVRVSACTVRVSKPDFEDNQVAAASWAGFPAQDSAPRKAVFRYTSAASGPAAVDKSGFDTASAGEGMDILTVSGDVHGAVLDLLKIKK